MLYDLKYINFAGLPKRLSKNTISDKWRITWMVYADNDTLLKYQFKSLIKV